MGTRWSMEDDELLIRMYPDHCASEIAAILGRTDKAVYSRARLFGLYSSMEHIRKVGSENAQHPNSVAQRFARGHIPANKGKKMPPETYAKVSATFFPKGQMPHNHRPVGSEGLRSDGYIWIKIAEPNKWVQKQRFIWMQHHGAIPKGYNVQFKNHDPQDLRIENLYLISRADQMRNENSLMASYPKPLADIIRLKGVVNRIIHKQERNGE